MFSDGNKGFRTELVDGRVTVQTDGKGGDRFAVKEVRLVAAALVTTCSEVPIEVAENGGFVVRADSKIFVCPMSKKQDDFFRELLRCDGKMDGNAIGK